MFHQYAPQTIFAGEFTSGNPDVVSEEETPEIFTNEEQEAAGETDEELSVFSSEEVPEFNDTPDEAMAAAENIQIKEIDLINSTEVYTISSAGDYKFTCSNDQETANRIVVDGTHISEKNNIKIYLDNVNINTSFPALQIQKSVQAQVYIYLEGINKLNSEWDAALQKDNAAKLTIDNSDNSSKNIGKLIATASFGAGIGGGPGGSGSNITISGGSVNVERFGCSPRKNLNSIGENPEVYRCTISNPQKRKISIDDVDWKTYNHVTGESVEDNLYAWLPGGSHTITVGNEKRTYSFDNNQFIRKKQIPPLTNLI